MYSESIGDVHLKVYTLSGKLVNLVLKRVLFVEKATQDLISCSALERDGNQVVLGGKVFPPGIYFERKGDDPIEINKVGSLYCIRVRTDHTLDKADRPTNPYLKWSARLGHAPLSTLQRMRKICDGLEELDRATFPKEHQDQEVVRAKIIKCDKPKPVQERALQPMQKIHFDIKGPINPMSVQGKRYALFFKDDCTGYAWVYFLAQKSELFQFVKQFLADTAEIRAKHPLNCMRCDNAGENTSKEMKNFLREHLIRFEHSAPYHSEQNGRVESLIFRATQIVKSAFEVSGVPTRFWPAALQWASDVLNVRPHPTKNATPHELLLGKRPNVDHFHPFGVGCTVWLRPEQRKSTFGANGVGAIYLGSAKNYLNTSCHMCLLVDSDKVALTKNVIFSHTYPLNHNQDARDYSPHAEKDDQDFHVPFISAEASNIANILAYDDDGITLLLATGENCTVPKDHFFDLLLESKLDRKSTRLNSSHSSVSRMPSSA